MATHSSILAWRIPWTEEPGGLQSVRSQRVGHDWSDLACTHAYPQLHETMQLGSCCSFLRNICSQILAGLQSSWGLTWVEVQDGAHTRLFGVVVGRSHQWGNGLHFSQHGGSAPRCSIYRASIPQNPGGSCQESSAYLGCSSISATPGPAPFILWEAHTRARVLWFMRGSSWRRAIPQLIMGPTSL